MGHIEPMQRRSFLKSLLALVAAPVVAKVVAQPKPKPTPPVLVPYGGPRLWVMTDGTSDCSFSTLQDPLRYEDLDPLYQSMKRDWSLYNDRRKRIMALMPQSTPYTPEQLRSLGGPWKK